MVGDNPIYTVQADRFAGADQRQDFTLCVAFFTPFVPAVCLIGFGWQRDDGRAVGVPSHAVADTYQHENARVQVRVWVPRRNVLRTCAPCFYFLCPRLSLVHNTRLMPFFSDSVRANRS